MILADTSVWVDHLRSGEAELGEALEANDVVIHPFIVGELACGNLRNRREVLYLLGKLPALPLATHDEAVDFIEHRKLMKRGIGYVDVHLLASVVLMPYTRLWTRDRRLADIAAELGVRHTTT
jgi:predicted nucleic acid-binding protein